MILPDGISRCLVKSWTKVTSHSFTIAQSIPRHVWVIALPHTRTHLQLNL